MKAALTLWDGRISPVFDVCREALVLTVENGTVVSCAAETIDAASSDLRVQRIVDLGIDTLVCGAISEPLRQELLARNIEVIGFVAGEIAEVMKALLAGRLPDPSLCMPGCGGGQRRFRAGPGNRLGRGPGRRRHRGP